jgi:HEAT repeat protein
LHALGQIDPHDTDWIDEDIAALGSTDGQTRQRAIDGVVAFGAGAVTRLTPLFAGPDPGASAALEAVARMGPSAGAATPALRDLLENDRLHLRRQAIRALGGIGPAAAESVPRLVALLRENKSAQPEEERITIVEALGAMGPGAKEAVPTLQLVLGDGMVGVKAAEALGRIGPAAASAIPKLHQALRSWPAFHRETIPLALGRIGSDEAVPALVEALLDSTITVNCAGLAGLTLIGPKAIPELELALHGIPESGSAEHANARYKIQAAIAHLRTNSEEPPECRRTFAEAGLR